MKLGMKEGTSEGQTTIMPRPGDTQTWDPRGTDPMGNNPRNTPNREKKTDAHGGMETDSDEGSPENKPEEEKSLFLSASVSWPLREVALFHLHSA